MEDILTSQHSIIASQIYSSQELTRDLRHPTSPGLAEELALGWQGVRVIQRAHADIPELLFGSVLELAMVNKPRTEKIEKGRKKQKRTYSILQNETPAIITKLPMDHHARAIIGRMFLGLPGGERDGVFGDLGREAVVGPKGFLSIVSAPAYHTGPQGQLLCNSGSGRETSGLRLARRDSDRIGFDDSSRIPYSKASWID